MHPLNELYFGKLQLLHHCMGSSKTGCSVSTSLLTSQKCNRMMFHSRNTCKVAKALGRRCRKLGFKSSTGSAWRWYCGSWHASSWSSSRWWCLKNYFKSSKWCSPEPDLREHDSGSSGAQCSYLVYPLLVAGVQWVNSLFTHFCPRNCNTTLPILTLILLEEKL